MYAYESIEGMCTWVNRRHVYAYESIEGMCTHMSFSKFVRHAAFVSFVKINGVQVYSWPDEILKLGACDVVPVHLTRDHSILASH